MLKTRLEDGELWVQKASHASFYKNLEALAQTRLCLDGVLINRPFLRAYMNTFTFHEPLAGAV